MAKLLSLYKEAKDRFIAAGISPEDALELIEAFTPFTRKDIFNKKEISLSPDAERLFLSAAEKRCRHYPLQYILGYWYFMDMKLKVSEGVLCPRDDTEVLVREAIRRIKASPESKSMLHGADLCSGTGCVALGLASEVKNVHISAVELYEAPFDCLTHNISLYGDNRVEAKQADVILSATAEGFSSLDFIISNPPYIKSDEMDSLQEEVTFEPKEALTDFSDGYTFYRFFITKWKSALKSGGFMAFEIDDGQAEEISSLFTANGFTDIHIEKDLGGLDRCISAVKI